MADDPLSDALRSLIAAGADAEICRRVLAQVRSKWTGGAYIRAVDVEDRNAEVKARMEAGGSVRQVAKMVDASVATIRRIWRG